MTSAEYRHKFDGYRELTERELKRLFTVETRNIYPKLSEAMFYSLDAGGKRIRPCLVLAVCEMLGGCAEKALPFACALEMIHTYSLIHDDMPGMDNDDMRRGRPSNHKIFGEGIALLAGDALLSFAAEIMLNAALKDGSTGFLMAAREIIRLSGASGMLTGQASDKENENKCVRTESMLRYIHRHKTADMLEAAVISGAYAAGADEKTIAALRIYSEHMGMLFQITDDLLDVTGDPKLMGKTLGKDAEEGKLTYVTLFGVDEAKRRAETAAFEAKKALDGIDNSDVLSAFIDDMLKRNR